MKKLLPDEERALMALSKYSGGFVPGDAAKSDQGEDIVGLLKQLVRKGRATVSETDDGPSFSINSIGRNEAAKIEAAG